MIFKDFTLRAKIHMENQFRESFVKKNLLVTAHSGNGNEENITHVKALISQ